MTAPSPRFSPDRADWQRLGDVTLTALLGRQPRIFWSVNALGLLPPLERWRRDHPTRPGRDSWLQVDPAVLTQYVTTEDLPITIRCYARAGGPIELVDEQERLLGFVLVGSTTLSVD